MAEELDAMTEQAIVEQVSAARSTGTALAIHGGKTKAFYGNPVQADAALDCSIHRGVIAYEPTELAVTVRTGTSLAEVEALLAEHGQEFPFEPPHFGERATIGGMVAAGLSGPRRPYAASVRDAVLGVRMLNGKGEVMDFGGRVMKNVAGYDLSRLMVGSLGVLGVLLEVSIKVMPRPPRRITLVQEQDQTSALGLMQRWAGQALPITGTAWLNGLLHVRVAGSDEALSETQHIVGGALMASADADAFWSAVREQQLDCFAGGNPLWRLSVPPAVTADAIQGADLIEWGGALRWLRSRPGTAAANASGASDAGVVTKAAPVAPVVAGDAAETRPDASASAVRAWAAAAGGHATLFRPGPGTTLPSDGVFAPLSPVVLRLHQRLKQAFDPEGIFNPGRLYR